MASGRADTGIGIPEDHQSTIFDSFIQANTSGDFLYEGTGLGLAISKHFLEMMGGSIWFTSREGRGTTFCFTAVFERGREKEPEGPPEDVHAGARCSFKMLVAEDCPINQIFITELIRERGHRSVVVEDGRQVLEALAKERFDLVLMDIRIPVIAVTAHALQEERDRLLQSGFDEHLAKPIDTEAFDRALGALERLKRFPAA